MLAEAFKRPGKEYRSAPFWSWNDDLQDDELVRQIAEMDAQGLGGFFMHSRVGLVTPYMSRDYVARVATCVAEARKRGMSAYLYDEDLWPSGFAGGFVTGKSPANRTKALVLRPAPAYFEIAESVATFLAHVENGRIVAAERLLEPPSDPLATSPDRLYLHFYVWTAPLGNERFDGFTYADLLDPDVVRAFLDANYEPYYKAFREDFGRAVPGIFTDEPCYLSHHSLVPRPRVPWTTKLPEAFAAAHGYDLLSHLPSLFYDVGDYQAFRYDFWRTITDRFVDSFTRQIGEWCEEHGVKLTGHVLNEDSLLAQTLTTGAAMPHYEYMQQPGIDHLNRNIANPLTVKQLDSAACQLDKRRTLSEMFGCSGQNMSFVDRKWIADWHYVLGVNLVNPHLALYSMRGVRKNDYPANLYFQQPWWPHDRLIEDYFGRLAYALTQGKRSVDVLVLHPIASGWTLFRPEDSHELQAFDAKLAGLVETLLKLHRDFHFGDDRILAGHASVEGQSLRVGEMSYSVVVVPSQATLARSTCELLGRFVAAGGQVVAIEPTPNLLDGRPSPEVAALLGGPSVKRVSEDRAALAAALDAACPPVVTIEGERGESIWYHLREDGERKILFLANTDRDRPVDVAVDLKASGKVEEWDPATGEVSALRSEIVGDATGVILHFEPAGSRLLVLDAAAPASNVVERPRRVIREQALGETWDVRRLDPNALTLDYCEYRGPAVAAGQAGTSTYSGGGEIDPATGWSRAIPVWKANAALRGETFRDGTAGNWFNVQPGIAQPFALRFRFEVASEVAAARGRLALAVESAERFAIAVNGAPVPAPSKEFWIDPSWRPVEIAGLVRAGENLIELSGTYYHDTELESIYLLGDFALEPFGSADGREQFRLVAEKAGPRPGAELERQGLEFYPGRLVLSQELTVETGAGRAFLDLGQVDATVATVRVNGQDAGSVAWRPWRVEVTSLLRPGPNRIKVELANSLHNLLGPHHDRRGELLSVNPNSFSNLATWTDRYSFVRLGLAGVRLTFEE